MIKRPRVRSRSRPPAAGFEPATYDERLRREVAVSAALNRHDVRRRRGRQVPVGHEMSAFLDTSTQTSAQQYPRWLGVTRRFLARAFRRHGRHLQSHRHTDPVAMCLVEFRTRHPAPRTDFHDYAAINAKTGGGSLRFPGRDGAAASSIRRRAFSDGFTPGDKSAPRCPPETPSSSPA
jgi:hypothetical protein